MNVSERDEMHIRDYVDRVVRELRADIASAAALALAGERDRVRSTLETVEQRLDGLTTFREAMVTQAREFPTREVVVEMIGGINLRADEREARIRHLEQDKASNDRVSVDEDRIGHLENFAANIKGRFWALSAGLTIAVVVVNVIIYFLSRHP